MPRNPAKLNAMTRWRLGATTSYPATCVSGQSIENVALVELSGRLRLPGHFRMGKRLIFFGYRISVVRANAWGACKCGPVRFPPIV